MTRDIGFPAIAQEGLIQSVSLRRPGADRGKTPLAGLFGGSAESLVMSLVETKHLTPAKLARLQELVAEVQEELNENK